MFIFEIIKITITTIYYEILIIPNDIFFHTTQKKASSYLSFSSSRLLIKLNTYKYTNNAQGIYFRMDLCPFQPIRICLGPLGPKHIPIYQKWHKYSLKYMPRSLFLFQYTQGLQQSITLIIVDLRILSKNLNFCMLYLCPADTET